jgi:hypothetical protein
MPNGILKLYKNSYTWKQAQLLDKEEITTLKVVIHWQGSFLNSLNHNLNREPNRNLGDVNVY